MNDLKDAIINYLGTSEPYAFQIDGAWGTGKTYFIKNKVMTDAKVSKYHPIYFSINGYDSLLELKQALFAQIVTNLSANPKIYSTITRISKKIRKISNVIGNTTLSSVSLFSDWIMEAYRSNKLDTNTQPIVIFIDDLERLSLEIALGDFLGFMVTELLENLHCRIIVISNSDKITRDRGQAFKATKEKAINKTIRFSVDLSIIKESILSPDKNSFIQEDLGWITNILLDYEKFIDGDINLRTLLLVIENFKVVTDKLSDQINKLNDRRLKTDITRSIFLNIFVLTTEHSLGNISINDLDSLNRLDGRRDFLLFRMQNSQNNQTPSSKIVEKYHGKSASFDNSIYYSISINKFILTGIFSN
ncbi:P-loop NTPase fold protein [Lapidilactobacillus salsurivasis]